MAVPILVTIIALAGCANPPPTPEDEPSPSPTSPCDDVDVAALNTNQTRWPPTVEPYDGSGRFELEPDPPTLEPGKLLTLRTSFTNPDCHTFTYTTLLGDCGNTVLAWGRRPLLFYGNHENVSLAPLFVHSCGVSVTAKLHGIRRGETYSHEVSWNGSVRLWDHSSVESGQSWTERTYWAAAGQWPLAFGFSQDTRYPVQQQTNFTVLANSLNRDSPLHPSSCRGLGTAADGFLLNATLEASTLTPRIGDRTIVWANYTLTLPSPGCYLFSGAPIVWGKSTDGSWWHGPVSQCGISHPFNVLIHANTSTVVGQLVFAFGESADPCGREPKPGSAYFELDEGGLPKAANRPKLFVNWTTT